MLQKPEVLSVNFVLGVLTIVVKHEGTGVEKVDSIWGFYAQEDGVVLDGTLSMNAGGQYVRYEEDVEVMVRMGMDAFRFSLAWTRIFTEPDPGPDVSFWLQLRLLWLAFAVVVGGSVNIAGLPYYGWPSLPRLAKGEAAATQVDVKSGGDSSSDDGSAGDVSSCCCLEREMA
ncbi:hypothetical protein L7F22_054788 [Adiantum nelumboides]|nr:hypothetical protein [Adiantum nelumboides]